VSSSERVAADELRVLEESLWRGETRFDRAYMELVLHPDFVEVGRSGKLYDRAASLTVTTGEIGAVLPLRAFTAAQIEPHICLLRYISEVRTPDGVERAERSSIWVNDGTRWLLRFHQATPTG
jgi:hypothetical protein